MFLLRLIRGGGWMRFSVGTAAQDERFDRRDRIAFSISRVRIHQKSCESGSLNSVVYYRKLQIRRET